MRSSLTLALALLSVLALAPAADAKVIDVPRTVRAVLPDARDGGVPVLLPSRMNLDYSRSRIYVTGGGGNDQWDIEMAGARNCGGANACFLASFTGEEGKALGFKTNVKLARGLRGYYKPLTCGGSCSPPLIAWKRGGVRYQIQAKALGGRKSFVAMANSAIRNGGR
jgi:hypothetical protein